jgi:hypothetical protein
MARPHQIILANFLGFLKGAQRLHGYKSNPWPWANAIGHNGRYVSVAFAVKSPKPNS